MNQVDGVQDLAQPSSITQEQDGSRGTVNRQPLLKRLRGGFLMLVGYLLSPLCWWNDLIINLPVAYGFGYLCRLISADFFLPGAIAGYWLSNLVGIVMMQFGAIDVLQNQSKERNFARELLTGVATSTVYTLVIVLVVQLKIIDLSAFLPTEEALNLGALLSTARSGN